MYSPHLIGSHAQPPWWPVAFCPPNPSPPFSLLVPRMTEPGASLRRGQASSAGRWWQ